MSKKYALLIGNAEYNDAKLNLKTPVEDVRALQEILRDKNIGAFDKVDVLTNATADQMGRAIGELFTRKHKPDDMLLLYFSGHGELDRNNRLYLVAKDTELGKAFTGVKSSFISDLIEDARSKRQVIILDACNSGSFGNGAKSGTKVGTKNIFEGNGYGRYVLTASDAVQIAWEGDRIVEGEITNSFFTHFLLDGLRTGAADLNRDGYVDLNELYEYIHDGMMQESGKQTPLKFTFKESGDLKVALSPIAQVDRERTSLAKKFEEAEQLLNELMDADEHGFVIPAVKQLLDDIMAERSRSTAYDDLKRLVQTSPRAARATWAAFTAQYPGYDPENVAAALEGKAADTQNVMRHRVIMVKSDSRFK